MSVLGARSDYMSMRVMEDFMAKEGSKGMFSCEQCGSERTGYVQYQIERADEPMTNFIYCYDCHFRYCCK